MPTHPLPPLSLYIHIPWCIKKCPYCDFNSHTAGSNIPEQAYLNTLLKDLDQDLKYVQGRAIKSIFIGGGTPSLFSPQGFAFLLTAINDKLELLPNAEITLEANPGAVEQQSFSGFLTAGINRLSIGVQSFSNQKLHSLGRIHSAAEATKAMVSAKKAGFKQINLDLMFGLPEQNLAEALNDLQQAVDLGPQHISWYQLTLEPNTVFYNTPPPLPDDERIEDMQTKGLEFLSRHGYQRYEVSAYATDNNVSKHNLNYWRFGDYIGIGAGAHSKITQPIQGAKAENFAIERCWKTRMPTDYLSLDKGFLAGSHLIPADELPLEFMMNALRLSKGFKPDLFAQHTGRKLSCIAKNLEQARLKGLLIQSDSTIKATELGYRYLNDLLQLFM